MKNFMRNLQAGLFWSAAFLFPPSLARATNFAGQPADFLLYGAGARALGMGGAFTAVADDGSAPYWNPAGLSQIDENTFTTMYSPLPQGASTGYAGYIYPMGPRGAVSLSDTLYYVGGIETRDQNNMVTNTSQNITNNAAELAYGGRWRSLSLGTGVRMITENDVGYSGGGYGADVGALYHFSQMLTLGLVVQNFNQPSVTLIENPDEYKMNTRAGAAVRLLQNRVLIAMDGDKVSGEDLLMSGGVELTPFPNVSFRLGLNGQNEYTYGIGLRVDSITLDFAYNTTDLGGISKVSFTYKWGNYYKANVRLQGDQKTADVPIEGLKTTVHFFLQVPPVDVKRWEITIKSDDGTVVKTLGASFNPPALVDWNGLDSAGRPSKPGHYTYKFSVIYINDKQSVESGSFNLTMTQSHGGTLDIDVNGVEPTLPTSPVPAGPQPGKNNSAAPAPLIQSSPQSPSQTNQSPQQSQQQSSQNSQQNQQSAGNTMPWNGEKP